MLHTTKSLSSEKATLDIFLKLSLDEHRNGKMEAVE